MSDPFITLWNQEQLEIERRESIGRLDHTASRQYRARGITSGDRVYVVATEMGQLLLIGRLEVERLMGQREADEYFGEPVYQAPDHLVGKGTARRLDRVVPEHIARRIQRASGNFLKVDPNRYRVDAMSLRTTGRITEESAALLDHVIEDTVRQRLNPDHQEGGKRLRMHLAAERSPAIRRAAIAIHGTTCSICGFDYASRYGALGDGFIEVHHLAPLGKLTAQVRTNPETDVAVVCANCHRMVHRTDPPAPPDKIREALR